MAKPRKPFSQLKPATQERKTRYYAKHQGLTAKQVQLRYDNGTLGPQKAARGHAQTPERPGEAEKEKNRERYKEYRERKKKAVNYIYAFKEVKWGNRPLYNAARARKAISHDPATGKERGAVALRIIENMVRLAIKDELDWHSIAALDYDYETAFYYH